MTTSTTKDRQPPALLQQPAKIVKRRQGIDNTTRLQICQFVVSQTTPPSTKIVREWAESTFGRTFPQSTISTLLRNNGLQIKQAGGRGRRCREDSLNNLKKTNLKMISERTAVSAKTNILVCQLKLLADGRCRGRVSDHADIELLFLEETYLMLKRKQSLNKDEDISSNSNSETISVAWFSQLARFLFEQHNGELPKNISQFLNQIYDKYYLMNMVYQHLSDQITYDEMIQKLARVYPELSNGSSSSSDSTSSSSSPSTSNSCSTSGKTCNSGDNNCLDNSWKTDPTLTPPAIGSPTLFSSSSYFPATPPPDDYFSLAHVCNNPGNNENYHLQHHDNSENENENESDNKNCQDEDDGADYYDADEENDFGDEFIFNFTSPQDHQDQVRSEQRPYENPQLVPQISPSSRQNSSPGSPSNNNVDRFLDHSPLSPSSPSLSYYLSTAAAAANPINPINTNTRTSRINSEDDRNYSCAPSSTTMTSCHIPVSQHEQWDPITVFEHDNLHTNLSSSSLLSPAAAISSTITADDVNNNNNHNTTTSSDDNGAAKLNILSDTSSDTSSVIPTLLPTDPSLYTLFNGSSGCYYQHQHQQHQHDTTELSELLDLDLDYTLLLCENAFEF